MLRVEGFMSTLIYLDPSLFEGDMIVSPEERQAILRGTYFNEATRLAATRRPWPRIVPYDLYELSMFISLQKQLSAGVLQNDYSDNFENVYAGVKIQPCNFTKSKLYHFLKILKTLI